MLKAITYRIIRILLLLVIALTITGNVSEAVTVSVVDAILATLYYYYFDRMWDSYFKERVDLLWFKIKYDWIKKLLR
jgi:uncharacterized membrane protein